MIIALTGTLCSGKSTLALYLKLKFGFTICNLYEVFAREVGVEGQIEVTSDIIEKFFAGKSNNSYF